jgi:hypothetical protein
VSFSQSVQPATGRPKRMIKAAQRYADQAQDDFKAKPKPKPRRQKEHGWYRVDKISGVRIVRDKKNNEQIELQVNWIGYEQPTWECFRSFVKDAAVKAERYFIKHNFKRQKQIQTALRKLYG